MDEFHYSILLSPICTPEPLNYCHLKNSMTCKLLYLVSVCCLGVWELSRHELKENNSIGIDIRLEAVWIVILHSDNLRSLWTYRQKYTNKHIVF